VAVCKIHHTTAPGRLVRQAARAVHRINSRETTHQSCLSEQTAGLSGAAERSLRARLKSAPVTLQKESDEHHHHERRHRNLLYGLDHEESFDNGRNRLYRQERYQEAAGAEGTSKSFGS